MEHLPPQIPCIELLSTSENISLMSRGDVLHFHTFPHGKGNIFLVLLPLTSGSIHYFNPRRSNFQNTIRSKSTKVRPSPHALMMTRGNTISEQHLHLTALPRVGKSSNKKDAIIPGNHAVTTPTILEIHVCDDFSRWKLVQFHLRGFLCL
jgi:hypothetical protein